MLKSKTTVNDLKIQLEQLKATQKEYLKDISKKEKEIFNKNLEKENLAEKIKTLSQEYQMKLQIHEEQLKRVEEKQKEKKIKMNVGTELDNEKRSKDEMTNKLNKLVETYIEMDCSKIVDEVLKEYATITTNFNNIIAENKKMSEGEKISSVQIKYKGKTISFKIIDDYYTFSDLLYEVCRQLEIDYRNHKISLSTGENLNLATGVKEHMQILKSKYKTIPYINLISTIDEMEMNIDQFMKQIIGENDGRIDSKDDKIEQKNKHNEMSQTANLLTSEIKLVEINLLEKFKVIIFYLVFLFIVYISNMSKNKIHQTYYINHAFMNQIYQKPYLDVYKEGLENNFGTINSYNDLKIWCLNVIQEIFNFKDVSYGQTDIESELSNKTFTTFMENFVVSGAIRIMNIRHNEDNKDFVYNYSTSKHNEVFNNYDSFRKLTKLETRYDYAGYIDSYSVDEAYVANVPPLGREMLLVLAMMNNVEMFNKDQKLFVISFNGYNYNQDVFLSISLYFEQNSFGKTYVNFSTCSLNFLNVIYQFYSMKLVSNILELASNTIIIAYSIYHILGIITDIKKEKLRYFVKGWNLVKIFKIALYVMCVFLRVMLYIQVGNNLRWVDSNQFIDTSNFCQYYNTLNIFEMLLICITLIYILNYLDKSIVGIIYGTLFSSWRVILVFIVSYLFSLIGYSAFCNYIYGVNIPEFRNLKSAIVQLFLMVFGDFSLIVDMYKMLNSITLLFTTFFALTFFLLFLNWLIGTIIHYYNIKNQENIKKKQTTGTGSPSGTDVLTIIGRKMFRSVFLFVIEIIKKVKESKLRKLLRKQDKTVDNKKEKKQTGENGEEINPPGGLVEDQTKIKKVEAEDEFQEEYDIGDENENKENKKNGLDDDDE